jgi:hypothetical protein
VVLDILLAAMPLVFAVLGFQRGIQREAMTLIGILLGALLVEIWAEPWAISNAVRFANDVAGAQALISVVLLLFSAIFIGYGGAVLLPSRKQLAQGSARWFGVVAGGVNGLLLIGLLLRYASLRSGLGIPAPLIAQTRVGGLLTARLPTLLLFGMLGGALIVVVRLVQRLLFKLHAKPEPVAAKPGAAKPATSAAKPGAAKPATSVAGAPAAAAPKPKPDPPKVPTPDSTTNPILRDLLLEEHKKAKQ